MISSNKLVAASCLAITGGLVAEFVKPQMPEGSNPGQMTMICVVIGLVVGWRVMGRRAGRSGAVELGLVGVVSLVFWGLLMFGLIEMLRLAMRRRLDEPVEALERAITVAMEYGLYLLHPTVLVTLAVSAVVSGYFTNFAARHWG
ncbi:TrgA family protein [uncultured Shimia sp.]|uniref:TrgA family protein n=1 Tax=uncultured Shimia sp. TaxID=573152 RepID=UPI0025D15F88|nr:TrgA family protein [uncultured Shimia sp.]